MIQSSSGHSPPVVLQTTGLGGSLNNSGIPIARGLPQPGSSSSYQADLYGGSISVPVLDDAVVFRVPTSLQDAAPAGTKARDRDRLTQGQRAELAMKKEAGARAAQGGRGGGGGDGRRPGSGPEPGGARGPRAQARRPQGRAVAGEEARRRPRAAARTRTTPSARSVPSYGRRTRDREKSGSLLAPSRSRSRSRAQDGSDSEGSDEGARLNISGSQIEELRAMISSTRRCSTRCVCQPLPPVSGPCLALALV